METVPAQENKMGVQPVNQLLLSMSLPMIASMLVQALYNVVDSIYVSRISENALNAVSLAYPVQTLMLAVATGTGVGINALLSKSLGEKNYDRANQAALNGVFLAGCSYVVFALLGAFFSRVFFLAQTDVAEIVEAGTQYVAICTLFSFGMFFQIVFERLLQATGRTIYHMWTQAAGAAINIVFDPICIFSLHMGVAGAAVATVMGQIAAAGLAIMFHLKHNRELRLSVRGFRPNGAVIRRIYAVGIPSIIMQSIGSVMTFGLNKILIGFTTTATAVSGVYFKLQSFVFLPAYGMNNGIVPIVAYNYGARKPDRVLQTVKAGIIYVTCIMALGFLVFQFGAGILLGFFKASSYMLEIGIPALRIISVHFLLAGFSVVSSSYFQAMGNGILSLTVSLVRQLLVLLPAAFLLSLTGTLSLVWWAFPIAEVVSVILCVCFHRRIYRREIRPMGA